MALVNINFTVLAHAYVLYARALQSRIRGGTFAAPVRPALKSGTAMRTTVKSGTAFAVPAGPSTVPLSMSWSQAFCFESGPETRAPWPTVSVRNTKNRAFPTSSSLPSLFRFRLRLPPLSKSRTRSFLERRDTYDRCRNTVLLRYGRLSHTR